MGVLPFSGSHNNSCRPHKGNSLSLQAIGNILTISKQLPVYPVTFGEQSPISVWSNTYVIIIVISCTIPCTFTVSSLECLPNCMHMFCKAIALCYFAQYHVIIMYTCIYMCASHAFNTFLTANSSNACAMFVFQLLPP